MRILILLACLLAISHPAPRNGDHVKKMGSRMLAVTEPFGGLRNIWKNVIKVIKSVYKPILAHIHEHPTDKVVLEEDLKPYAGDKGHDEPEKNYHTGTKPTHLKPTHLSLYKPSTTTIATVAFMTSSTPVTKLSWTTNAITSSTTKSISNSNSLITTHKIT